MRRTRATATVLAGIAILASAALLAWRASEHGPDPGVDPKSAARSTPTDSQEAPPALLEVRGSPTSATLRGSAGGSPEGIGEAAAPVSESVPVTLRLLRSDGGTVDRAYVRIPDDKSSAVAWNPQTGVVSLPRGRQFVEVLGGRFGEWRQPEDFWIDIRAGMPPVEITLRPWRMIVGQLKAAETGQVVRAGAQLRRAQGQTGPAAGHRDECSVELRPPNDGWFSFGTEHELQPGTYVVTATPWMRGPVVATQEVVVTDHAVSVELDLPRRSRADGVTLRLEDSDGQPLKPTTVYIQVMDTDGVRGGGDASLEPLGDGRYWVPTLLPGYTGWPPVSVTISVRSSHGERRTTLPVPNTANEIPIRFEAPARLSLSLTHRNGWLAGTSQVDLWEVRPNGRSLAARVALDKENGTAQFPALQPGDYWLAALGDAEASGMAIALTPVSLKSGENTLEIAAPLLYAVQVHMPHAGLLIMRSDDPFGSGGMLNRGEGAGTIHLPAGKYTLVGGGESTTVEVPGTSEVRLDEKQPR